MEDNLISDEAQRERAEKLRKAVEAMFGHSDSIFALLLKSLLNSFLGLDRSDRDAPDFEDVTDPAQRARLENDYSTSREGKERQQYGDYRQSVGKWNAASLGESATKLADLRTKLEAANGGRPIDAISPVAGNARITSEFGHREAGATGGVGSTEHKGLDIAPATPGTKLPIIAPMTGTIVGKGWRGGYGNMIELVDIYGVHHRFGHLDSTNVEVGQIVNQGDRIATMGTTGHSTGVHLHYEQRDGDSNPRAPQIAGHVFGKGESLAASDLSARPETAPVPVKAAASTPEKHPQQAEVKLAVQHLRTRVVAVVDHHPHANPTGLTHAFDQAQKAAHSVLNSGAKLLGLA